MDQAEHMGSWAGGRREALAKVLEIVEAEIQELYQDPKLTESHKLCIGSLAIVKFKVEKLQAHFEL